MSSAQAAVVYVKTIVDEKKFLEAVKLICCFNLTVKFSLRELLNRCVEDVKSNSLTVLKDSSKSEVQTPSPPLFPGFSLDVICLIYFH